ncbi:hypothetical protein DSM3645_22404 [Blastopirellula marina DSM 3645]|uniref:Uncharacterized protein n=1 Tax=Blastopirellula marina DSM 3645 TaxID=314230 RepID=A3ZUM4_9BACT|nr:hypothetical protein DSM3645_22404 [Blastopirellula marina DSM 3645]
MAAIAIERRHPVCNLTGQRSFGLRRLPTFDFARIHLSPYQLVYPRNRI